MPPARRNARQGDPAGEMSGQTLPARMLRRISFKSLRFRCLHNCKFMVNLAHCTRTQVPFAVVHIFHIFPRQNPPFFSTAENLNFHRKSSYAPSYPHYPHFFSSFHSVPTTKLFHPHFCEDVINLPVSTKKL